jgi:predicted ABC-type sugar transport system permease subunit
MHSQTYLAIRGVVRAIFWGTVVIGSTILVDWFGREVVMNLPW